MNQMRHEPNEAWIKYTINKIPHPIWKWQIADRHRLRPPTHRFHNLTTSNLTDTSAVHNLQVQPSDPSAAQAISGSPSHQIHKQSPISSPQPPTSQIHSSPLPKSKHPDPQLHQQSSISSSHPPSLTPSAVTPSAVTLQ